MKLPTGDPAPCLIRSENRPPAPAPFIDYRVGCFMSETLAASLKGARYEKLTSHRTNRMWRVTQVALEVLALVSGFEILGST